MLGRIVIAMALCTVGGFVLGWTLRDVGSTPSSASAVESREPASATTVLPGFVDRKDATSLSIGEEDHTHEVVVDHSPYLESSGAYTAGTWEGKEDSFVTVTVTATVTQGSHSEVEIVAGTGFGYEMVRLVFDAKTGHVTANVESEGDAYPQPPPPWQDVSGHIWVSRTTWGEARATTFEYTLYGLKGGYRQCTHGKIYVDL